MQKKTLIVAALTVAATMAGFVVAGTALGADWHEYQGRISAGQAYAVPVPAGAESLSFVIVPAGDNPVAKLVVFDANDERVGSFALDSGTESSDVVDPVEGAYMIFVYELRDAQLSVRLQADEPGALKIVKGEVVRKDAPIVREFEGKLSKDVTVGVKEDPIFATILYTGTVENLNAKLDSPSGTVLTITNESGVSYAPGLAIGASDARDATMENLAPGMYRAHVTADLLDGSLWLTTLTYKRPVISVLEAEEDVAEPADAPKPHSPHSAHSAHSKHFEAAEGAIGATIRTGVPTAVEIDQPMLAIGLRSALAEGCIPVEEPEGGDSTEPKEDECEHEHQEDVQHSPAGPWGYGHDESEYAVVTVISPADELLGVYYLSSDEPIALLEDLESGEYVMFVHGGAYEEDEGAIIVAYPENLLSTIPAREIGLVENAMDAAEATGATDESEEASGLVFETPPLMLAVFASQDSIGVDHRVRLEGPAGVAFESNAPLRAPLFWGFESQYVTLENLVAGEYALVTESLLYEGTLSIYSVSYDRALEWGAEVEADEEESDDGEAPVSFAPGDALAAATSFLARLG